MESKRNLSLTVLTVIFIIILLILAGLTDDDYAKEDQDITEELLESQRELNYENEFNNYLNNN